MVRSCLLLIPAAVGMLTAQQVTDLPPELPLSKALDIALTNSTNIRRAMAELNQSTGRTEQSRSPLLPQVNFGARQGYLTINLAGTGLEVPGAPTGKIGPFASMDARVFVSQQILNLAAWREWKSTRTREDSYRLLV